MVLTAIMLILMLVTVALGVTTASRRATARYAYNVGLFDLAVSGNEQALFLLRQLLIPLYDNVSDQAWTHILHGGPIELVLSDDGLRLSEAAGARFEQAFVEGAMAALGNVMGTTFSRASGSSYLLYWNFHTTMNVMDYTISNIYRATTTLRPAHDRFVVDTIIRKYVDNVQGFPTEVHASIIWTVSGHKEIALDAHTIDILEANGSVSPVPLSPGTRIILDVFTLTMVESLRVAN